MTRPDVQPIKRKPLTKLEFARLAVEQKGKCAKCGVKLTFEPHQVRDEHIISLFGGGTNDLSNRELWCVECTKAKDKADSARHAKIRHLRGETGQQARRNRNGSSFRKPEGYVSPLSRQHRNYRKPKFQSRGFGKCTS